MENFLNTANHFIIIIITLATVGVIALARKTERPVFPALLIIVDLALLLYHSYLLNRLPSVLEYRISQTYLCLAMDFLWLLISFLGYLWIDDIRGIKLNKKNYDNSMAWFWSKL